MFGDQKPKTPALHVLLALAGGEVSSVRSDDMAYNALGDVQKMASDSAQSLVHDLETWKADHYHAMRCRDVEDRLRVLNALLQVTLELKARHDSAPMPKDFEFDEEADATEDCITATFSVVSSKCNEIDAAIRQVEGAGYFVEGSNDFRAKHAEIDRVLQEAKRTAKIEGLMGFRGVSMAPEDAKAFRALLDAHSNASKTTPNTAS